MQEQARLAERESSSEHHQLQVRKEPNSEKAHVLLIAKRFIIQVNAIFTCATRFSALSFDVLSTRLELATIGDGNSLKARRGRTHNNRQLRWWSKADFDPYAPTRSRDEKQVRHRGSCMVGGLRVRFA